MLALTALLTLCLTLAGCEGTDRSYATSPALKTLIGTTTGNTAFNAPEPPPAPQAPPDRWQVEFGLARFTELQNGSPAIEVVGQVSTRPGAGFEFWLETEGRTVARWSAGSTTSYVGTVCFQLELQRDGEAVPLGPGKHTATFAFRDPGTGIIAARRLEVTNTTPILEGAVPGPGSEVFREGLACRRGQ